jgi:mannose-1-phosphate guanylyltransferase
MAGGAGTRFWPRSVKERPKQFLALTSEETMLQMTYRRFQQKLPQDRIYVVTAKCYESLVREQLPELSDRNLLLEPDQRDTGPCIALTALHFLQQGDDEVLVTLPSDHYTEDADELYRVLLQAERAAKRDRSIVTLGIVPTRPETGFGYIRTSAQRSDGLLEVLTFIEKPKLELAESLIRDPGVFWNSGIFVWKPSTIGYYMELHQPDMWNRLAKSDAQLAEVYADLPKISIDYAILEKADMILTAPVRFKWDDVGIWTSLERIQQVNEQGNIIGGSGKAYVDSTTNSIVYTDRRKTLLIGVSDIIVVSTEEGLLVCHKSAEQKIKSAIQMMDQHEGGA